MIGNTCGRPLDIVVQASFLETILLGSRQVSLVTQKEVPPAHPLTIKNMLIQALILRNHPLACESFLDSLDSSYAHTQA